MIDVDEATTWPPQGVCPLLGTWGGEAIYMNLSESVPDVSGRGDPRPRAVREIESRLKQLGTPTIVVARISIASAWTFALPKLFVGAALCLEEAWADVLYRAPIPPQDVLDIWQPGDADYDRHERLPRE